MTRCPHPKLTNNSVFNVPDNQLSHTTKALSTIAPLQAKSGEQADFEMFRGGVECPATEAVTRALKLLEPYFSAADWG
jgi:hypothetical protein